MTNGIPSTEHRKSTTQMYCTQLGPTFLLCGSQFPDLDSQFPHLHYVPMLPKPPTYTETHPPYPLSNQPAVRWTSTCHWPLTYRISLLVVWPTHAAPAYNARLYEYSSSMFWLTQSTTELSDDPMSAIRNQPPRRHFNEGAVHSLALESQETLLSARSEPKQT